MAKLFIVLAVLVTIALAAQSDCTVGQYWDSAATTPACVNCVASRTSAAASAGIASCKCLVNTYGPADNTACTACPEGETAAAGSTQASDCSSAYILAALSFGFIASLLI